MPLIAGNAGLELARCGCKSNKGCCSFHPFFVPLITSVLLPKVTLFTTVTDYSIPEELKMKISKTRSNDFIVGLFK